MEEPQTSTLTTKRVLVTSLAVDIFDLLMNAIVAAVTGSAIMVVEALEGFAGLCSVAMLLFANKRSNTKATKLHPFGYGREISYWSTIAAFVIVASAGVFAVHLGYQKILSDDPQPIRHAWLAFIALAIALSTNGYSFWTSLRKLLDGAPMQSLSKLFLTSPRVAPKTTVVLDAMGSAIALVGLFILSIYTLGGSTAARLDGVGALAMGLGLIFSSGGLLLSVRALVMNQGAPREMERKIRDAAREVPEVKHVVGMQTTMVGSDKVLANIDVHLKDGLNTDQVEQVVEKVKEATQQVNEGVQVHVEPDAMEDHHNFPKR
ncbi:MAG TPA: cation diffusion facilitator family transporter [Candidatus Saccharimonadales bacterium]|nr:cation diffusion facilitator family transporter [Candidatus Saccharimonadales bacterium]